MLSNREWQVASAGVHTHICIHVALLIEGRRLTRAVQEGQPCRLGACIGIEARVCPVIPRHSGAHSIGTNTALLAPGPAVLSRRATRPKAWQFLRCLLSRLRSQSLRAASYLSRRSGRTPHNICPSAVATVVYAAAAATDYSSVCATKTSITMGRPGRNASRSPFAGGHIARVVLTAAGYPMAVDVVGRWLQRG